MRLFILVIFSLSINVYADALRSMDFPVPADVIHTINNLNAPVDYKKNEELAKDAVEGWLKIGAHSKIILTLKKMKTSASAKYYVKVQFCRFSILTDCIAKSYRSADFDMSDVDATVLDIKFSTFSKTDWVELAELLIQDQPIIKIQLMKVTSVFEWRPDLLQFQDHYDLADFMTKQSAIVADPSIRFELQLQVKDLRLD